MWRGEAVVLKMACTRENRWNIKAVGILKPLKPLEPYDPRLRSSLKGLNMINPPGHRDKVTGVSSLAWCSTLTLMEPAIREQACSRSCGPTVPLEGCAPAKPNILERPAVLLFVFLRLLSHASAFPLLLAWKLTKLGSVFLVVFLKGV